MPATAVSDPLERAWGALPCCQGAVLQGRSRCEAVGGVVPEQARGADGFPGVFESAARGAVAPFHADAPAVSRYPECGAAAVLRLKGVDGGIRSVHDVDLATGPDQNRERGRTCRGSRSGLEDFVRIVEKPAHKSLSGRRAGILVK